MKARLARAVAAVITALTTVVLIATPALAAPPTVHEKYPSLGVTNTILIFVGIPFGVVGLVAALVYGPSLLRGPRYRPAQGWDYDPLWFNGPDDPDFAMARTSKGPESSGGAAGAW